MTEPSGSNSALGDLKILELGQLIAGPFATALLASFGAQVIKVEAPGVGDPLRKWRKLHAGTSLWWRAMARNKRCIELDLRREAGQAAVRRLVAEGHVDVVVENFRPGRLEQWGIGYAQLRALNPRLIMVRVSGWGQDGPRAREPGFANIAEAFGGLRHLTAEPGRAPVRSGVSLGDTVAGLHAALGLMIAVHHRDRPGGSGEGQVVDVALYEAVFNLLESTASEYAYDGEVRQPTGAALPGIVPTNTYPCREGWVAIGANSDAMFRRLMLAIGREDLATDPGLAQNDGRSERAAELDAAIAAFTRARSVDEVLAVTREAEVAAGPIYAIDALMADPQVRARELVETHELPDGQAVSVPAALPKLSDTPGETRWLGPELGADTEAVLGGLLGMGPEAISAARGEREP